MVKKGFEATEFIGILLKNEIGMVLPIILVIVMVIVLLGTALAGINVFEIGQVRRQENKLQAYYLARSGLDATASWLENATPEQRDIIRGKSTDWELLGPGIQGEFKVNIDEGDPLLILLTSIGRVEQIETTVTLTLIGQEIISEEGQPPIIQWDRKWGA